MSVVSLFLVECHLPTLQVTTTCLVHVRCLPSPSFISLGTRDPKRIGRAEKWNLGVRQKVVSPQNQNYVARNFNMLNNIPTSCYTFLALITSHHGLEKEIYHIHYFIPLFLILCITTDKLLGDITLVLGNITSGENWLVTLVHSRYCYFLGSLICSPGCKFLKLCTLNCNHVSDVLSLKVMFQLSADD